MKTQIAGWKEKDKNFKKQPADATAWLNNCELLTTPNEFYASQDKLKASTGRLAT